MKRSASSREAAEVVALQALAYLAADPDRLDGLMAATGADADTLRALATRPAGLGGVLDHVLRDESLLLMMCEETGLGPADVARAGATLDGAFGQGQPDD